MHILRREIIGGIVVITLDIQSLDATNVSQVTALVMEATRGQAHAVVDLGTLRYFDVRGFAAILKWAIGGPNGPEVRFCSRSGNIQALSELLRADTVFSLYQTREDAMASLDCS